MRSIQRFGLVLVLLAALVAFVQPARADALYWVDAFLDSGATTINANVTDNISTITENDNTVTKTVLTRLWLSQGWFLNGTPTKAFGPATTCVSNTGSRVWDCTTTLSAGLDVQIDWPIVSRVCLPSAPQFIVEVWVDGVKHDTETHNYTGGTGRIACTLTWYEQHLTLANNTSYFQSFALEMGWSSAHSGKVQAGISSNSTMAQMDVVGSVDQVQLTKQPGNVFQEYCPAFATHTYGECQGSPSTTIWQTGAQGYVDTWYHTYGVDGQIKQWVRFYDGATLIFEQIYFANIS